MSSNRWTLQQVVLLALLGFLFGGVFMGAGFLYAILEGILLPLGLGPFANEILFGLWTMAAPMAGMLIPKKGSAVIGELLAALAEMLYGSYFGPGVLISGFIQGIGAETGFALTRYRRYDQVTLLYSAIGTTIFSFIYEFFKNGYGNYSLLMIFGLLIVRFLSVLVFGVFMVSAIMKIYERVQKLAALNQ
ncbi:cobalt ABC transporter permease [Vagococcus penaei]|uniref:Cobalt ABC transporter permease n=1 Tax=Vagococcus penaei TaxID=633807 RepID=A0A1Q2D344_9ENTE|nr:ECF transporter S component [Vagococcus penaei]AQP52766.1 cobalt ABC transporter permease [Vagococcus penaei]RST98454.1 cobalt ABC transporter permease [Vagococcus penaei]